MSAGRMEPDGMSRSADLTEALPERGAGGQLLEVESLRTSFFSDGAEAKAVDGVGFSVDAGETLALVGESGWS